MITLKSLGALPENHELWKFLKKDTLRRDVFDLILDVAFELQVVESDRLTPDALRASAARIEFARTINEKLPVSKEELKPKEVIFPDPVE